MKPHTQSNSITDWRKRNKKNTDRIINPLFFIMATSVCTAILLFTAPAYADCISWDDECIGYIGYSSECCLQWASTLTPTPTQTPAIYPGYCHQYGSYWIDDQCAEDTNIAMGPCSVLGGPGNEFGQCFRDMCGECPRLTPTPTPSPTPVLTTPTPVPLRPSGHVYYQFGDTIPAEYPFECDQMGDACWWQQFRGYQLPTVCNELKTGTSAVDDCVETWSPTQCTATALTVTCQGPPTPTPTPTPVPTPDPCIVAGGHYEVGECEGEVCDYICVYPTPVPTPTPTPTPPRSCSCSDITVGETSYSDGYPGNDALGLSQKNGNAWSSLCVCDWGSCSCPREGPPSYLFYMTGLTAGHYMWWSDSTSCEFDVLPVTPTPTPAHCGFDSCSVIHTLANYNDCVACNGIAYCESIL